MTPSSTPDPPKRVINAQGHVYRLQAGETGAGSWRAYVSSGSTKGSAATLLRAVPGARASIGSAGWSAEGPTAEAALDALEERIRAAVEEATRADVGAPVQPRPAPPMGDE
jgi:hypothetical protein